jgi:Fe-S-cluster containining protein
MNNLCNKCGKCCQAIWLAANKKQVKEILVRDPNNTDAKFIFNNWKRISKKEALKTNPHITVFTKEKGYFYKCDKYDHKNKRCGDYENRPKVCSGFPFYEGYKYSRVINGVKKLTPFYALYSKKCGFQKVKATMKEWTGE